MVSFHDTTYDLPVDEYPPTHEGVYQEFEQALDGIEEVVFLDYVDERDMQGSVSALRQIEELGWESSGLGYQKAWSIIEEDGDEAWDLLQEVAGEADMGPVSFLVGKSILSINDLFEHIAGHALERAAKNVADKLEERFNELGLDYT